MKKQKQKCDPNSALVRWIIHANNLRTLPTSYWPREEEELTLSLSSCFLSALSAALTASRSAAVTFHLQVNHSSNMAELDKGNIWNQYHLCTSYIHTEKRYIRARDPRYQKETTVPHFLHKQQYEYYSSRQDL